jgi:hypothetical protein
MNRKLQRSRFTERKNESRECLKVVFYICCALPGAVL